MVRENVLLYRIVWHHANAFEPRLLSGRALKVSASFLTFTVKDEFSGWQLRHATRELGRVFFESPRAAWLAFKAEQAERFAQAKVEQEQASENVLHASRALSALVPDHDAVCGPGCDCEKGVR